MKQSSQSFAEQGISKNSGGYSYESKDRGYFANTRQVLIGEIPTGPNRVLEIGCGEGATAEALKAQGRASSVVGVEIEEKAAEVARSRLDHVVCGDLESLSLNEPFFAASSFDYLLLGDVLEHLRDPWGQLARLASLLAPGGGLVTSIPNVRHRSAVIPLLLKGEWGYGAQGILDSTHLRFFTRRTAIRLVEGAGFALESCQPRFMRSLDRSISKASLGKLDEFAALQWVITARKRAGG